LETVVLKGNEQVLLIQGCLDPPREQIGAQLGAQGLLQLDEGQDIEQLLFPVQVAVDPTPHWSSRHCLLQTGEAQTGRQLEIS